jgi:hypothetical protein
LIAEHVRLKTNDLPFTAVVLRAFSFSPSRWPSEETAMCGKEMMTFFDVFSHHSRLLPANGPARFLGQK